MESPDLVRPFIACSASQPKETLNLSINERQFMKTGRGATSSSNGDFLLAGKPKSQQRDDDAPRPAAHPNPRADASHFQ